MGGIAKAVDDESDLYGGISEVCAPEQGFDFGEGLKLTPAQAHFMRPCLITARRPEDSFPAMQSACGSFGFDIVAELRVPATFSRAEWFDRPNTIWWITALLRLRGTPRLRVPVLANRSFSDVMRARPGSFWPVETESERTRMILDPEAEDTISPDALAWVRDHWLDAGNLMQTSREFNVAVQAFDQSSFARDPTLALLLLWGGIEAIFSPAISELRFRISSNIAAFLEPPGKTRAETQQRTAKLYDARSAAAHGRREDAEAPLIETYALMRRALLKIIANRHVPTKSELDAILFCVPQ